MTKTQPPADDLVERVARAMWDANKAVGCSKGFHEGASDPWELCEDKDDFRVVARAAISVAAAEIERLHAMCDELAVVLEPFADLARSAQALPDNIPLTIGSSLARRQLTVADFKRIEAAYAKYQESKGG